MAGQSDPASTPSRERRVRSDSRGVALLEVLAALMILGVASLSLIDLLSAGTRAVVAARSRERELADEERLLAAYTLLARTDLDRRIGARDVGPYHVDVQRPEPTLYRIALSRTEAVDLEDLVTVVYRAEPTRAP
jgi:Tfp pilus assembly protein PilV